MFQTYFPLIEVLFYHQASGSARKDQQNWPFPESGLPRIIKEVIYARNLCKNFQIYTKAPGFSGAIKSLFHRNYLVKPALSEFDIDIKKGELVGLLGPNGAGKTTLMKLFTGIIAPSFGTINVLGYNPSHREKEFRQKMSMVMGQKSQLWWDLPALDSFRLLRRFYALSKNQFSSRLEELATLLDVNNLLQVHLRKLSLGERMKMELIGSLLHSPQILFLDEPTIGLDLVAQEKIRNFILDLRRKENLTIILTSHYMDDVETLCERIVFVKEGKKEFDGTATKFAQLFGPKKIISIHLRHPPNLVEKKFLEDQNINYQINNQHLEIIVDQERTKELSILILQNFDVIDFGLTQVPLERVVKELTLKK